MVSGWCVQNIFKFQVRPRDPQLLSGRVRCGSSMQDQFCGNVDLYGLLVRKHSPGFQIRTHTPPNGNLIGRATAVRPHMLLDGLFSDHGLRIGIPVGCMRGYIKSESLESERGPRTRSLCCVCGWAYHPGSLMLDHFCGCASLQVCGSGITARSRLSDSIHTTFQLGDLIGRETAVRLQVWVATTCTREHVAKTRERLYHAPSPNNFEVAGTWLRPRPRPNLAFLQWPLQMPRLLPLLVPAAATADATTDLAKARVPHTDTIWKLPAP
jgi:hypothetical protein